MLSLLTADDDRAESNQYRSLLLGYVLFSIAMIFGGIWAYLAWGTYWLWTPKELWTTIVWFFYSLYLHARLVRGWTRPEGHLDGDHRIRDRAVHLCGRGALDEELA